MKNKATKKILSFSLMLALVAGIITPISMATVSAESGTRVEYAFENFLYSSRDEELIPLTTERYFGTPDSTNMGFWPLSPETTPDKALKVDVVSTHSAPNRPENTSGGIGNYQSLKVYSPGNSFFRVPTEDNHVFDKLVELNGNANLTFWAKTERPITILPMVNVKDNPFGKEITIDSQDWKQYKINLREMTCRMPDNGGFGNKDFITITREGAWSGSNLQEAFYSGFRIDTLNEAGPPVTWYLDTLAFEGDGISPLEDAVIGALGAMPDGYSPNMGDNAIWKGSSQKPDQGTQTPGTQTPGSSSKPNGTNSGSSTSSGQSTTPDGNLLLKDDVNNVSVEAAKGILPDGSTIAVKAITDGDSYTKAQTALKSMNPKSFVLYDIAVLKDGTAVTFNGKVKVTMPIPQGYDTDKLGVFSIGDDGKLTEMAVSIGEGTLSFETEHFSLYTIVDLVGGGSSSVAPTSSSEDTAKKGMSKTTLIIIIVAAAVVLLLGGGAAYYFLVMKKKDSVDTENTEIPENTVDAEDTENKTDKTENK